MALELVYASSMACSSNGCSTDPTFKLVIHRFEVSVEYAIVPVTKGGLSIWDLGGRTSISLLSTLGCPILCLYMQAHYTAELHTTDC